MPQKKLHWAILSTARINRAIIPPLLSSKRNELVGVSSRSQERAQVYAQSMGIPRAYGSYEAMLADPEIDVIYIPLPNSLHAKWTIAAAKAGKHVLCEKPLAITEAEVDDITATARHYGVVVAEAFMYRHHPQTLRVKELVDNRAVGKLRFVRGSFSFNLTRAGDIRLNPALGGGSIWDIGCYPINYARYIIGKDPEEVFGWQISGSSGVDMTFVGQMRFAGDIYAQIDFSFQEPYRSNVEIVGDAGTINIPHPYKPGRYEKIYLTSGDEIQSIPIRGRDLYAGEVEDMADAILLGKEPRLSLEDSRGNVSTIISLLRSAREKQPVYLNKP